MARYLNVWKEKHVVSRKAYHCEYGRYITEHEYMVSIETDDGRLLIFPVLADDYLRDYTADEFLKEIEDEDVEILHLYDRPKIKESITEWICNEGAVSGSTPIDAICEVVSILTRNGLWEYEYSKFIDMKKIEEEYGE